MMTWAQVAEWLNAAAIALGLKHSFIAGMIGAVVSLKFLPDMKTWWERLSMVISGAFAANYCAPLTVAFFDVKSPGGEASVAFLIGLFGMSLVAAAIKMLRDGVFVDLIRARFGAGGDK